MKGSLHLPLLSHKENSWIQLWGQSSDLGISRSLLKSSNCWVRSRWQVVTQNHLLFIGRKNNSAVGVNGCPA